jgi:beta-phosphoglucomutase
MLRAIIFDAEGVVVDTERIWDHGQEEFLKRRGVVYDRARIKPLLTGASVVDGVRALKREYGLQGDDETLARERLDIVRDLFAREVQFIPGFLEFFARVRGAYKTCIATAMAAELLEVVDRRLRLYDLFGGRIYTLADIGFRAKPQPDLFLHAARELAVAPSECLVMEDAPLGIEAVRRAGMRSVGLATTYDAASLADADQVITSFTEIDLGSG